MTWERKFFRSGFRKGHAMANETKEFFEFNIIMELKGLILRRTKNE
jgi:hypothetical protein